MKTIIIDQEKWQYDMAKLSQLTDNCWIMKTNADELGYLFKRKDDYLFLTRKGKVILKDEDDITKTYGKISYQEREEKIDNNISGFPIRHKDIEIISQDPPIFVKKNTFSTSKVQFYAGFWSVKYPNGWSLNFCPKTATIEEYESEGPFRTRLECVNNNNLLNTRKNIQK